MNTPAQPQQSPFGNVQRSAEQDVVTLTPTFKLVLSVLAITLFCLVLEVFLSLREQNEAVKNLNEKLLSVFTPGCGAIIGLLGRRTLK